MTIQEKNELLNKLRILYNHADRCKITCMEHGRGEDAALLSALSEQLRAASDNLIRGIYRDWVGGTEALGRWLDRTNEEMEKCLQELGSDPDWPRRIAKITEYIEDIVGATGSIILV